MSASMQYAISSKPLFKTPKELFRRFYIFWVFRFWLSSNMNAAMLFFFLSTGLTSHSGISFMVSRILVISLLRTLISSYRFFRSITHLINFEHRFNTSLQPVLASVEQHVSPLPGRDALFLVNRAELSFPRQHRLYIYKKR